MKLIIGIVLLALSGMVSAETLSWEPPTTRVDGTPLDPATELSVYELSCGGKKTEIPATGEENYEYEVTKHEILPEYGEHKCFLVAVDNDGLKSEPSNTVSITWEKSAPGRPTSVIIITE